jgi:WD40 repeat protein
VEVVAHALRSRGLTVFLDRWYLVPGRSWTEELEAALACAKAAVVFIGPGEMGQWQRKEKNFALDRQAHDDTFRVIPVLLPGSDPALGFLGQNTWIDLRLSIEEERELDRLAASIRGLTIGSEDAAPAVAALCPYRGLLYFREEDAPFFYGREEATAQVYAAVKRRNVVAVVGASGSGKSSVVRAGLLPVLQRDRDLLWEVITVVPSHQPLAQLARAMVTLLKPDSDAIDRAAAAAKLVSDLESGRLGLTDLVHEALRAHRDPSRLIVFVDQWEELYTLTDDEQKRRRFVDLLLDATEQSPCCLVLTLRADFVGSALAYRRLSDRLQDGQVNLGPMTPAELRSAIEAPAQKSALAFEPGLVTRILDDVGGEPGNLPLLEFVLKRLWEMRRGNTLLHASYDNMGGLSGAVAAKAEEVFSHMSLPEQESARDLFLQLVRPGNGAGDTRRRAAISDLGQHYATLVRKLSDERLLVTGSASASEEETVEVSHEALIQNWTRLKSWLDQDRAFLLWHDWLRAQFATWEESKRDDAALLRGSLLAVAERWLGERGAALNADEREYIERSVALRERDEEARRREAMRERELEHTRVLASEQQKRADAEALRAQEQARAAVKLGRHRRALAAGVVLIVVLSATLLLTLSEQSRARERQANAYSLAVAAKGNLPQNPDLATLLGLASAEATYLKEEKLIPAASAILTEILREPAPVAIGEFPGSDLHAVAFRPGMQHVGLAGKNMPLTLWDTAASRTIATFGPGALWLAVAFSPDATLIAGSTSDGDIRIWHIDTRELRSEFRAHTGPVFDVRFSHDGQRLFSAAGDNASRVWDVARGTEAGPALRHGAKVYSVALSARDGRVATAGTDRVIRIWDPGRPEPLRTLTGHRDDVLAVDFSPSGQVLASASRDGTIGIWEAETGHLQRALSGHTSTVTSIAFSPDGRRLASTSHDRSVRLWDPTNGHLLATLHGHADWSGSVAFSSDGMRLASVGGDKKLRIWNTNVVAPILSAHGAAVLSIAFDDNGSTLATASYDRTVQLWDGRSGRPTLALADHGGRINAVTFSPDGRTIVTASDDRLLKMWDALTGEVIRTLKGHQAEVLAATFTRDGRYLVSAGGDHVAHVWDVASGLMRSTLQGHQNIVFAVAADRNGRIATGSYDGSARLWDGDSGRVLNTFKGHTRAVDALAFSPDGATLATGSWDGDVKVWDTTSSALLHTFIGHTNQVTGVAFSPDGTLLASVGRDAHIRLWDVKTGRVVVAHPTNNGAILAVAFSPDGKTLATGHADGLARLHTLAHLMPLPEDKLVAAVRARVNRAFTPEECRQFTAAPACSRATTETKAKPSDPQAERRL